MSVTRSAPLVLSLLATVSASATAQAQDAEPPSPGDNGQAPTGQAPNVTVVPMTTTQTQTQVYSPGYPLPGTNLEGHLPSSSHATTDATRSSDGFDLNQRSSAPVSVRGGPNGSFVVTGREAVPTSHRVARGDTLWDISGRYYETPYSWPRLWAQNPQILNPHWIYPGDRLKLRDEVTSETPAQFAGRRGSVPPKTVFLRDVGWIDDIKNDTWGELVGSPDEQMLLSFGDDIYLQIEEGHDVTVGQELVIFKPLREVTGTDEKGDSVSKGELVSIRGTARVDRYNEKTRIVRAKITESLDVIERGAKVGPVGRRFDVVPPVTSDQDIEARILASLYPLQLFGQEHVVFIDKGEKDGVKVGQRFFAIRRGDKWRSGLRGPADFATKSARVEDDRPAELDDLPAGVDGNKLPDESYAELRVIRMRDHTATALVTASTMEIERTARLVSRKGY